MRPCIKSLFFIAAIAISSSSFAGQVSRALFTIGVDNHEPVIMVDSIDSSSYTSISFFTELNDLAGQNITHQWTYNDKVMFEKSFEVRGPRWRVSAQPTSRVIHRAGFRSKTSPARCNSSTAKWRPSSLAHASSTARL